MKFFGNMDGKQGRVNDFFRVPLSGKCSISALLRGDHHERSVIESACRAPYNNCVHLLMTQGNGQIYSDPSV